MILALDVGNSRIKWGLWQDPGFVAQGSIATVDAPRLFDVLHVHARPQSIIGSNVAGVPVAQRIEAALRPWRLNVRWIDSRQVQCGVTSDYLAPETLGTDRWAALIGAYRRVAGAAIVVDAGTAITIDALSAKGRFLGGLILPGIELMERSLADGTAGLALHSGSFEAFPRSTMNAIRSGALYAVCGAVERMMRALQMQEGTPPRVVLAGGAAPLIAPLLAVAPIIVPTLVLEGLVAIATAE
ncbi:MAG TPA: type III pantothenate kinase [Burkholderiales bacterium]|nr:type III pantothenate kinase [Burkholderiales bacterium]